MKELSDSLHKDSASMVVAVFDFLSYEEAMALGKQTYHDSHQGSRVSKKSSVTGRQTEVCARHRHIQSNHRPCEQIYEHTMMDESRNNEVLITFL